jgi:hypothetical protein
LELTGPVAESGFDTADRSPHFFEVFHRVSNRRTRQSRDRTTVRNSTGTGNEIIEKPWNGWWGGGGGCAHQIRLTVLGERSV